MRGKTSVSGREKKKITKPKRCGPAGYLTKTDVRRWIKRVSAVDPVMGVCTAVQYKATRRISDILNVKKEDGRSNGVYVGNQKSGKRKKTFVPLSTRDSQKLLDLGAGKKAKDRLFPFTRQHYNYRIIEARTGWSTIAKGSCDAKDVTTHSMRRSAATHLFEAGVSIPTIKKHGDWDSLDSLMQYLHSGGKQQQRVQQLLAYA